MVNLTNESLVLEKKKKVNCSIPAHANVCFASFDNTDFGLFAIVVVVVLTYDDIDAGFGDGVT